MDSNTTRSTERIVPDDAEETVELKDFFAASAPAFAAVWDNPEDAVYDAL